MKFLQTIISNSQKIIQCLSLPSTNNSDTSNILIFFQEYFQLYQIEAVESGVNAFVVATFPLETPLLKCFMIGNYIGLITNDCYLLIFHSTPPFTQKSKVKICDTLSPSTSPFAHIASCEQKLEVSPYFKNIILTAFIENNTKLLIDSEEHLDIVPFKFPRNFIVLSSTFTKHPNIFAFLISDFSQKHYLLLYDINELKEIEIEEVQNDSFSISTSTDIDNNLYEIFIFSPHSITQYKGNKIDLEFRLLKYFPLLNGEFLIQTEKGTIFGFDPKQNKLFKKGNLPLISTFHSIQNNFLLCVTENEDSFIIPFSSKYPVSENSIEYQLLPRTNFNLSPRMITAIFKHTGDNKSANLITASDLKVTSYSCTIPFTTTKMEDLTYIFNDQITYIENSMNHRNFVNSKIKIFCIKDVNSNQSEIIDFIATTNKYSTSFFGKVPISVNPTIDIRTFCENHIIQIHKKGIKSLNFEFEWNSSEKDVVAGSIGNEYVIAVLNDMSVVLFDRNLQLVEGDEQAATLDAVEGKITAVTFCNSYVAVATVIEDGDNGINIGSGNDGKKGSLTIFSTDFDRIHSQIFLLSSVVSLVFDSETQYLYASTTNGHVLTWRFDTSGYIDNDLCTTIFINQNSPSSLVQIGLDLLIANDDGLFIYDTKKLSFAPIQIGRLLALCAVDNDSFFALMHGSLEIYRVRITRETSSLLKNFEFPLTKSPRRLVCTDDLIVGLVRMRKDTESYLGFFNQANFSQFNYDFTLDDSEQRSYHLTPISMVEVTSKSAFVVGLAKVTESAPLSSSTCGSLFVIAVNLDGENQTVSVVKKIDLRGIPFSMKLLNENEVLVGVNKSVHVLSTKDWKLFDRPVAEVPTQAAFIDFFNDKMVTSQNIQEKFVWVADRTQSIFCFKPFVSEVSQYTMLQLAAVDNEQRQITAMQPLNDFTIAIGDKFGCVAVLRLPSGLVVGAPSWGEWQPPERGASVPAGRCLEKVATFSVGQAITSILINTRNSVAFGNEASLVFFYTTLFGQIGAVVQISSDEEFAILNNAARVAEKICNEEFGFLHMRRYQDCKRAVVSTKYFDFIDQIGEGIQGKIEEVLNFPFQQIQSLLCRYKAMATF